MAKYFRLLIVVLLFTSCTRDVIQELLFPTISLDARLPMDSNGYYHLQLNPTTNQTIHRITGEVLNITEPTKVSWWSNLTWTYNGEVVPTINGSSYVGENGEVNTVIAPIYGMKNDTLQVVAEINEWNITQTLNIVLE